MRVGWLRDYDRLPVKRSYMFAPHVHPKSDHMAVELIGPVDAPEAADPATACMPCRRPCVNRSMKASTGSQIKSLPVSRGAIPWFWNWADRRYAVWWDSQGLRSCKGPNMLFLNSATPRIDAEECALLDATNCQAMFCHTEWYRDLIAQHRGPANQLPINHVAVPDRSLPRVQAAAGRVRPLDLHEERTPADAAGALRAHQLPPTHPDPLRPISS